MAETAHWIIICTRENRETANALFSLLGLREYGFDLPLSANGAEPPTHYASVPAELPEFSAYLRGEALKQPLDYDWNGSGITRQDAADMLAQSQLSLRDADPAEHLGMFLAENGLRVIASH